MTWLEDNMNSVICGNSIEIMKQIEDKSIDMINTDVPYLISYKTNYRINKDHDFCSTIENDDNPDLIIDYIEECYRIMKDNTAIYMFCSWDNVDFFKINLSKLFEIKNMIIWDKGNWTAGDLYAQFGKRYEILFLANKGKCLIKGKRHSDIWNFKRISGNMQYHQNEKPIRLLERCLLSHSNEGDIIFEGFGGSGSLALACINLNRNYILIEKEEKYCEIARKRIHDAQRQTRIEFK